MTDPMPFADDQSLQRAGSNLGAAEAAADEVARAYAAAEAAAAAWREAFGKMRDQFETDLPTSPRLVADVQAVHARATGATSADAWRGVASDAATLPRTYQREHQTDIDRLDAPRTSYMAEKRADVTSAEKDN